MQNTLQLDSSKQIENSYKILIPFLKNSNFSINE